MQERSDYGEEVKGEITAQPNSITEFTSTVKVENIGDMTPVQDFEAMISRRDSPDWVSKAIKDMCQKIFNLIEDSCEGDTFPKALECLVALRKGCILEQVIHLLPIFSVQISLIHMLKLRGFIVD